MIWNLPTVNLCPVCHAVYACTGRVAKERNKGAPGITGYS